MSRTGWRVSFFVRDGSRDCPEILGRIVMVGHRPAEVNLLPGTFNPLKWHKQSSSVARKALKECLMCTIRPKGVWENWTGQHDRLFKGGKVNSLTHSLVVSMAFIPLSLPLMPGLLGHPSTSASRHVHDIACAWNG